MWRPEAALRREVGAGAVGPRGAPGAALRREVGAGAVPGAALRREVGAGAVGPRGASGAALRWEVGVGAVPGAALRREVGARAAMTRGGPGATLSQEVGAGAATTRGSPGAAMSREPGTTPPSPPPRPSTCGQGVVVPVTPPANPHLMITRGKTGFKVVRALQYLTFTWPDIAYTMKQICLHLHDPREPHLMAMKRILRYL
jgi:hypothetical protein